MPSGRTVKFKLGIIAAVHAVLGAMAVASSVEMVVSVPEQKLYVFNEAGEKVTSYRISTASRGLGDSRGSYATPLGKLEVAAKIGHGAPVGAVFKSGHRTGEICKVNARGRDPIVTRILHLRGTEARNAAAYSRCIYIHGTPDEKHLGKAVSFGCIRMASSDVVELFDMVGVGSKIEITQERVTGMFGGVVRRPAVRLEAVASAPVEKSTSVAVSAKSESGRPAQSVAAKSMSDRLIGRTPESKDSGGSSSHVRLMETSGLTISFGGGSSENSDRPRR